MRSVSLMDNIKKNLPLKMGQVLLILKSKII